MKLHKYQSDIVNKVLKSVKKGNKHVLIQSPAGSGKTVMMAALAKMTTDQGKHVLFMVHRKEICEQVYKTFTDFGVNMNLCYVNNIQFISRHVSNFQSNLILCDEAHHSLAKSYLSVFNNFPDAIVLGFTATPWRSDKKELGKVYNDLILGPEVEWLINHKYLSDFRYYAPVLIDVTKLEQNTANTDFSDQSINKVMNNRAIYGDVVKTYRKLANNTKTIIYTHNVESAINIAKKFSKEGYSAVAVSGKTRKSKRDKYLEDFRNGEITILANAELYGEGIDIPDCETIIMLRPTESLIVDIQQSMRGMRFLPNKTATIIDHVGNFWHHGLPTSSHFWGLNSNFEDRKTVLSADIDKDGRVNSVQRFKPVGKPSKELTINPFITLKKVHQEKINYTDKQALDDVMNIANPFNVYSTITGNGGSDAQAYEILKRRGLCINQYSGETRLGGSRNQPHIENGRKMVIGNRYGYLEYVGATNKLTKKQGNRILLFFNHRCKEYEEVPQNRLLKAISKIGAGSGSQSRKSRKTSGKFGVGVRERRGKYSAVIGINHKERLLGQYDHPSTAKDAWNFVNDRIYPNINENEINMLIHDVKQKFHANVQSKSGEKGIYFVNQVQRWVFVWTVDGKRKRLGSFISFDEAKSFKESYLSR